MPTLEMPYGKTVDLADVKSMDDDEFNGLLSYAKQFDDPGTAERVAALEKARGGKSDDSDDADEEGYAAMTVDELKEELEERDLPVSGNKAELVARLDEDDVENG